MSVKRGDLGPFWSTAEAVQNGNAKLWVAVHEGKILAAAVTSIVRSEWRLVCEINACGGKDRKQWLGLIGLIESYARAEQCSAVRIMGRKGWARVLPDYLARQVILEKALS